MREEGARLGGRKEDQPFMPQDEHLSVEKSIRVPQEQYMRKRKKGRKSEREREEEGEWWVEGRRAKAGALFSPPQLWISRSLEKIL